MMLSYFRDSNSQGIGPRLTMLVLLLLGVAGLALAEQLITGWIALGERANISRRDINFVEALAIVLAIVFGAAALRTAWSLLRRDLSGWPWSQWVSFGALLTGVILLMKALLPHAIALISNLRPPGLDQGFLIAGLVLLFTGLAVYMYVTRDVQADDAKVDKAQGALSTAASDMTPSQFISFQLSKSPSAGAIIGFVFIFLAFSFVTDLFLQPTSIASVLTNVSTKGIVAIGVTILMISGEFDLSVGSMLGASALFFMLFMTEGIPQLGIAAMPTLIAIPAALLVAMFLGFINGFILVRTGIPSFIVTLGTLLAYRAIPLVAIPGGRILRYKDYFADFPQIWVSPWVVIGLAVIGLLVVGYVAYSSLPGMVRNFQRLWRVQHSNGHFGTTQALATGLLTLFVALVLLIVGMWLVAVVMFHLRSGGELFQVGLFDLANGRWEFSFEQVTGGLVSLPIPTNANFRNSIIWWLVLVLIFHVILTRTSYGNSVFAVGGNPGAARAQGINVSRIKIFNFVLVAFLVGIASIFEVARNPGVDPLKGLQWELEVIAMTVIGGALLSGGYGSIIGTLLGALIFGMLQTGLVLIGMNARLFEGIVGIILVVAVVLNTVVRRIPKT